MKCVNLAGLKVKSIKVIIFVFLFFISFGTLMAQWSNNPSSNLIICQQGEPISAKVVCYNGQYLISYFKGVNRNNCHYLQILDFDGHPKFSGDGLMISNHPFQTSPLSDLIIDLDGNIIIAFGDNRNDEYSDIVLYKMDFAGNQFWGNDGISLSIPGTEDSGPQLVVNPDNSITVCFGSFDKINWREALMQIYLYRISESGMLQWNGIPRILKDEYYNLVPEGVQGLTDGGELLAYSEGLLESPAQLRVKKIDQFGNDAWSKDLFFTNNCAFLSANSYQGPDGILYLSWVEWVSFTRSISYIQGISPDGNLLWPEPGTRVSESTSASEKAPTIQTINSKGSVFVLWHQYGVHSRGEDLYGQLVSQDGNLEWDKMGLIIKEKFEPGCFFGSLVNDTAIVVYWEGFSNNNTFQKVKATALDPLGNFIWPGEVVLNDLYTSKSFESFTPIVNGQGVIVFTEDDGVLVNKRLVAQNICKDGTLGVKGSGTDPGELKLNIHVYAPSGKTILIEGVTGLCDISIYNMTGICLYQKQEKNAEYPSIKVDDSNWHPGLYIVKIQQSGRPVFTSKVMIY